MRDNLSLFSASVLFFITLRCPSSLSFFLLLPAKDLFWWQPEREKRQRTFRANATGEISWHLSQRKKGNNKSQDERSDTDRPTSAGSVSERKTTPSRGGHQQSPPTSNEMESFVQQRKQVISFNYFTTHALCGGKKTGAARRRASKSENDDNNRTQRDSSGREAQMKHHYN